MNTRIEILRAIGNAYIAQGAKSAGRMLLEEAAELEAQAPPAPATWRCEVCDWTGAKPSISDASEVRGDGTLDRVHVAVCPRCFNLLPPRRAA